MELYITLAVLVVSVIPGCLSDTAFKLIRHGFNETLPCTIPHSQSIPDTSIRWLVTNDTVSRVQIYPFADDDDVFWTQFYLGRDNSLVVKRAYLYHGGTYTCVAGAKRGSVEAVIFKPHCMFEDLNTKEELTCLIEHSGPTAPNVTWLGGNAKRLAGQTYRTPTSTRLVTTADGRDGPFECRVSERRLARARTACYRGGRITERTTKTSTTPKSTTTKSTITSTTTKATTASTTTTLVTSTAEPTTKPTVASTTVEPSTAKITTTATLVTTTAEPTTASTTAKPTTTTKPTTQSTTTKSTVGTTTVEPSTAYITTTATLVTTTAKPTTASTTTKATVASTTSEPSTAKITTVTPIVTTAEPTTTTKPTTKSTTTESTSAKATIASSTLLPTITMLPSSVTDALSLPSTTSATSPGSSPQGYTSREQPMKPVHAESNTTLHSTSSPALNHPTHYLPRYNMTATTVLPPSKSLMWVIVVVVIFAAILAALIIALLLMRLRRQQKMRDYEVEKKIQQEKVTNDPVGMKWEREHNQESPNPADPMIKKSLEETVKIPL